MTVVAIPGALALGFGLDELQEFFVSGLDFMTRIAVMFIFYRPIFGILSDASYLRYSSALIVLCNKFEVFNHQNKQQWRKALWLVTGRVLRLHSLPPHDR